MAAWLCLVITLASGTLLRYQWTGHSAPWFNSQYLLHAHSHVALLGWAFLGIFGVIYATAERPTEPGGDQALTGHRRGEHRAGSMQLLGEGGLLALILLMTLAFLLEGYAFWSILLSMLHILISFVLIGVYLTRIRSRLDHRGRPWIDLSILWFVVATLGPLLLAGGARMGEGWIEAWVGYYLTLLFNGWLIFAVIGLLAGLRVLRVSPTVRDLMALGVLPTAVPSLMAWVEIPMGLWVGWVGSLVFGGGLVVVGWALLRRGVAGTERREVRNAAVPGPRLTLREGRGSGQAALLASVAVALLLVGGFTMVGTFPALAEPVAQARMLVIGFIHLQLLGLVSAALVLILYPARPLPVGLFLAGGWVMITILLVAGGAQLLGHPIYLPLQGVLTLSGGVALAGALLLPFESLTSREGRPG